MPPRRSEARSETVGDAVGHDTDSHDTDSHDTDSHDTDVAEISLAAGSPGTGPTIDGRSFATFYESAWHTITRGLTATLGDAELAAEATDEAMTRAYQRWSKVQHYGSPAGWVYKVGLNWTRSHHRRAARKLPFIGTDRIEAPTVADPSIAAALATLDHKHRSVVVCRLLLDWSVEQTAEALDIRPGTVKSRLHRALAQLESALAHLR